MIDFYTKISDFRAMCIEIETSSSFYFKVSSLYTKLMTTLVELDTREIEELELFESQVPTEMEMLFHYLWYFNARARYECFIRQDNVNAQLITDKVSSLTERLFSKKFQEDDLEKKSFIFILAINNIRLSYYKKDFSVCSNQLKNLLDSLNKEKCFIWDSYPLPLKILLNKYADELINQMTEEQIEYFLVKIKNIEKKLQQQASY